MSTAEFYADRSEVQRPPEQDPPLTMRVVARELRDQPWVGRAIRVQASPPWLVVDGPQIGRWCSHDEVRDWYIDHGTINIACAYRWHTAHPPERQEAPQAAERGDLDVSSFKG